MDYIVRIPSIEEYQQMRKKIRERVIERLISDGLEANVSEWERDEEQDDIYLDINGTKIFYDDVLEHYK